MINNIPSFGIRMLANGFTFWRQNRFFLLRKDIIIELIIFNDQIMKSLKWIPCHLSVFLNLYNIVKNTKTFRNVKVRTIKLKFVKIFLYCLKRIVSFYCSLKTVRRIKYLNPNQREYVCIHISRGRLHVLQIREIRSQNL